MMNIIGPENDIKEKLDNNSDTEKIFYKDNEKIFDTIKKGKEKGKEEEEKGNKEKSDKKKSTFDEKAKKGMENSVSNFEAYNKILERKVSYEKKKISASEYINFMKNSPLYKKIPEDIRKEMEENRDEKGRKNSVTEKQLIKFMEFMLQDPNFFDKIVEKSKQVKGGVKEVRIMGNGLIFVGKKDRQIVPYFYPRNIPVQIWEWSKIFAKRVCTDKICTMHFPKKKQILGVRGGEGYNREIAKFEKKEPEIKFEDFFDEIPPIKQPVEVVKNQEVGKISFDVDKISTGDNIPPETINAIKFLKSGSILNIESSVDYRSTGVEQQLNNFYNLMNDENLSDLIKNGKIIDFDKVKQEILDEAKKNGDGNLILALNRALRLIKEVSSKTERDDIKYSIKTLIGPKPTKEEEERLKNMSKEERENYLIKDRFARFTADVEKTKNLDFDLSSIDKITDKITKETSEATILIIVPENKTMEYENIYKWQKDEKNKKAMDYIKQNYSKEKWTKDFFIFAQCISAIINKLEANGIDIKEQKINFKSSIEKNGDSLQVMINGRNKQIIYQPQNPYADNKENNNR